MIWKEMIYKTEVMSKKIISQNSLFFIITTSYNVLGAIVFSFGLGTFLKVWRHCRGYTLCITFTYTHTLIFRYVA